MKLRPALLFLHRRVGIVSAAFLLVVAVTGCILIFEDAIDRATHPSLSYVTPGGAPLAVGELISRTSAAIPGVRVTNVRMPEEPGLSMAMALSNRLTAFVNPYTGALLGIRDNTKGFSRSVHLLHTRFLAGTTGELIVGWLTVLTLGTGS